MILKMSIRMNLMLDSVFPVAHNASKLQRQAMNKPITIEDIARHAGVSASTVSRVLNGSKRVAEDKRALVMAAIEQHQFRPNMMARGLVHGRTMMIGVLAQDIDSPFFAKMVGGIEQRLAPTPYRPMLTTTKWDTENDEDIARSLRIFLERQVDGLIVLGGRIPEDKLREIAAQIPLIVVARRISGLEAQCLYIDNEAGAYRATRYLIGLGHRRVAHVTGTAGHPDAIDRLAGYRRALEEAGIAFDDN